MIPRARVAVVFITIRLKVEGNSPPVKNYSDYYRYLYLNIFLSLELGIFSSYSLIRQSEAIFKI
jgi:hypothetical protein